jgi:hypothetical protein
MWTLGALVSVTPATSTLVHELNPSRVGRVAVNSPALYAVRHADPCPSIVPVPLTSTSCRLLDWTSAAYDVAPCASG